MVLVNVCGETYHVKRLLYEKWSKINNGQLAQVDDDKVYVVDGRERSGKSLFTLQQAGAIDPQMFEEALQTNSLPTVCFSGDELLRAVRHYKSTKDRTRVIIFDEAFRGLASSSVLSKTNRMIVQALMEMGQNNLVLFIVLPSYFLLDRYPAVLRSNALIHIKKEKKNPKKRIFEVYNYHKKATLYHMGVKKGWGYPVKTIEKGSFFNKYPGGAEIEKIYRRKKLDAFREIEGKLSGEENEKVIRWTAQRNVALHLLNRKYKMQLTEISKKYSEMGINLSSNTISEAIKAVEMAERARKSSEFAQR